MSSIEVSSSSSVTDQEDQRNACGICGKSFILQCSLRTHMQIHTEKRMHSCPTCGKRFRQKAHMTQHMLIHSGEKPHSCGTCGKSFSDKANLTRHILVHRGVKPFSCPTCGERFRQRAHMTRHRLLHSGGKPHSCGICGKSFARKDTLTEHEGIHRSGRPQIPRKSIALNKGLSKHGLRHSDEEPHSCDTSGKPSLREVLTTYLRPNVSKTVSFAERLSFEETIPEGTRRRKLRRNQCGAKFVPKSILKKRSHGTPWSWFRSKISRFGASTKDK